MLVQEWLSIAIFTSINMSSFQLSLKKSKIKAYFLSKQSLRREGCLSIYITYLRGLDSCCCKQMPIPFSHLIRQAKGKERPSLN